MINIKKSFKIIIFIFLANRLFSQVIVIAGSDTSYHSNLQSAYNDENSAYRKNRNVDWQVLIENKTGFYSGEGWKDIYWGSSPNPPHVLIIRPSNPTKGKILIKGDTTSERCLRIARCQNVIIEGLHFTGFFRIQLSILKSEACTVRNCSFSDMKAKGAWCAIEVDESRNCEFENNTFYNLDSPDIALHAFYLKHSSYNIIKANSIDYCSGGVFKCVRASHHNIFNENIITGGCGDYAYFVARNPYDKDRNVMDAPSYANLVINTITTGPPPPERCRVYKNNAVIRRFVFTSLPDSFPEYTIPNHFNDRYDSTKAFFMPKENDGNRFKIFNPNIEIIIDSTMDDSNAHFYFPLPIYKGKFSYNDYGAGLRITPDYEGIGYHQYLKEIKIELPSTEQDSYPIEYEIQTVEGDIIKKDRVTISRKE